MNRSRISSIGYLGLGLTAFLVLGACDPPPGRVDAGKGVAQNQPVQPLSVNDVSILFPAPTTAADLNKLIAVADITTPNAQDPNKGDPVWPADAFQQFVAIA